MSPSTWRAFWRYSSYQLAFSGIGLAHWIGTSFGDTSLDQILWQLRFTERAAVHMSGIFLFEFIFQVLVFPCAFAVMAALLHTAALPYARQWKAHLLRAMPVAAGGAALALLLAQFSVFSYAAAQFEPDRFTQSYVAPDSVRITQQHRRNLVLIYAESLEQTYGDAAVFGQDLLAPIRRLGGFSYSSYRMAAGASWTIAAMVATQCGVPLKVYTESDLRDDHGGKVFLPRATCLGDVLRSRGYQNVFLGGAPLSFSGKGAFLRDHGYAEAWGRDEWQKVGLAPDEVNEWGLYDSALYKRARARLVQLHASSQPFNLTLLTMDTHNPHGFYSPFCRKQGARDFGGIVNCAAVQIAGFVDFMRSRGYLKDTTVVVIGDHLAKPNPVSSELEQVEDERRIFNLFITDPQPTPRREEMVAFDLYPTMLDLLGMNVEGGRLGLGYSTVGAVQPADPEGRSEEWSVAALRGSRTYDALWQPEPESAEGADAPDEGGRRVAPHEGD